MDTIDELIVGALGSGPRTSREMQELLRDSGHVLSQSTLSRRLRALRDDRQVVVEGIGPSTRYARDPYHDWFSVAPGRRPKVGYRFELLEEYEPNVTRWVSPQSSASMTTAGGGRRIEASTYSRSIAQKLLVDLSFASSAMEGNTYSYLDTQVLIEFGQEAEGKALAETRMILNHKDAINYLVDNVDDVGISVIDVRNVHALLSNGLLDPRAVGGVRTIPVDITGSAYVPIGVPAVLEEQLVRITDKARRIEDPFEQSLFVMTFLSYLQFFQDVNKRTGRLICNVPLLKAGLAPLSFLEMDKAKYVRGLVAFYELGRPDLIAEAYVEGYVASAKRYDIYAGRDRRVVEIEFRRRSDIHALVRTYVASVVEEGVASSVHAHAVAGLAASAPDEDVKVREAVAARVVDVVAALNEGNHVAYGISRTTFDAYHAVTSVMSPHHP